MERFAALRAIVWAQSRVSANFLRGANKAGIAVQWIVMALWYLAWVAGAAGAGYFVSGAAPLSVLEFTLPLGLFGMFSFWQVIPVVAASQGGAIDLRRLLAFPIPSNQLFLLEVTLRVTTAPEMLILCAGLCAGFACNRALPLWSPFALLPFIALNLLLAAGIKSLLERAFRRKGIRELLVFGFVALTLLPQLLDAAPLSIPNFGAFPALAVLKPLLQLLPWSASARLALGQAPLLSLAALAFWVAGAYVVSRRLFARSLRLEEHSGAAPHPAAQHPAWQDRLFRWPSAFFSDPLAVIAEKECRSLFRSSRFRLTFLMAAAMGALLWLPAALRNPGGWTSSNYLIMTCLYGALVLGDSLYWNIFGFERASAQQWFVIPVSFRQALWAKNIVSAAFSLLSLLFQALLAVVLPVHVGPPQVLDALATLAVFLPVLLGAGNLASVYAPRPTDPDDAWRNNGGKLQLLFLAGFPILALPPFLAYAARWAMDDCYWIFHAVMAAAFAASLCFYVAATDSAAGAAEERKEQMASALARTAGPVSTGA